MNSKMDSIFVTSLGAVYEKLNRTRPSEKISSGILRGTENGHPFFLHFFTPRERVCKKQSRWLEKDTLHKKSRCYMRFQSLLLSIINPETSNQTSRRNA